ncbi:MAG: TRAFAC clade GTPase domain-containing protein [Egibacteraceae bacterium]
MVHIFDPAGERFYNSQHLQELQYFGGARSFLFVVDPLTIEAFWESLPPGDREVLAPARANVPSPEFIYQQTVQNIAQMGVDPKRCQLGIAISKADLVRHLPTFADAVHGDTLRDWLDSTLRLSNMVRLMEKNFAAVRFFTTAAVFDEAGRMDPSVTALANWFSTNERLRIAQPPTAA